MSREIKSLKYASVPVSEFEYPRLGPKLNTGTTFGHQSTLKKSRSTLLDEMRKHNTFVKKGWKFQESLSSYVDFNQVWVWVTLEALIALCGMIPLFGTGPVLCVWFKYMVKKRHLFYGRELSVSNWKFWFHILDCLLTCYFLVHSQMACFFALRDFFVKVPEGSMTLRVAMDYVQAESILNLTAIASLLLGKIILIWSILIKADIQLYKDKVVSGIDEGSRKAFEQFQDRFGQYFWKADDAPETVWDESSTEHLKSLHWVILSLSTLGVFFSMVLLKHHAISFEISSPALLQVILYATMVTYNWAHFLVTLLSSAVKILRNSKQLLIFRAFVQDGTFSTWSRHQKGILREIIQDMKLSDAELSELKETLSSRLAEENQSRTLAASIREPESDIASASCFRDIASASSFTTTGWNFHVLIQTLSRTVLRQASFDLRQQKSVKSWWGLRRMIIVDFLDESCIIDFCATVTLLLLAGYAGIALVAWTTHKEQILLGKLSCAGGLFTAASAVSGLAVVLYIIVDACIDINTLLEADSPLLLNVASEMELDFQCAEDCGQYNNNDSLKLSRQISTLILLEQRITRFDDYMLLLGIPITKTVRTGLLTSASIYALNFTWDVIYTLVSKIDVDDFRDWDAWRFLSAIE